MHRFKKTLSNEEEVAVTREPFWYIVVWPCEEVYCAATTREISVMFIYAEQFFLIASIVATLCVAVKSLPLHLQKICLFSVC